MAIRSTSAVIVVGLAAVVVAVVASLAVGDYRLSAADTLAALCDVVAGRSDATMAATVVSVRLARAVGAVVVGASLGASGCALQALLRNPLASPFVVGTAQGAGFGAVLAIFLGLSQALVFSSALVVSVAAAFVVIALSRTERSLPTESVVLTGLSVSLLFGALIGLVRYVARDETVIGRISIWILGGLYLVRWPSLLAMAPVGLAALVATCLLWRRLDLLALGETDARRLGLRAGLVGTTVLLLTCVMTSLAVSIGGVVAFVGLVVPHTARRLVGPAHSALLPASAALGALLVIGADAIARTAVPPQELPLGVVTSLVGVPAFLVILRSLRRRRTAL